jgi:hypothetical protein
MKTTRTQFLTVLATGVAVAALKPLALLGAGSEPPDSRAFKALVGETFRFQGADGRGPVDLVLSDYTEAPQRSGTRQFTLTLVAPGGENLREGTYIVDQPRTGTFQMFVIPAGRDAKGQTMYRADFNLLVTVIGAPAPVRRR